MLQLIVYDQWSGIFFLGDHFNAVARGRKFYVIVLVCLGSAFLVLCFRVLVCVRQLLFLVLCRKCVYFSWGYWCPFWGHWSVCGYTSGRRCLPIVPLSWLFLDTIWPDIVPWKTLTEWSGCPHICVKMRVSLRQSKLCLTSGIWLSCERWLLFFYDLPRPCSLVYHVLFLSMSPVGWWFPPRFALVRGFWPSAIV